jgi:hypothetical protein
LHALANGPLARGPLLDSAAKLGCKPENLHRLEGCLVQRKREEVGFITLYLGEFHMTRKGRKRLQAIADADAAPALAQWTQQQAVAPQLPRIVPMLGQQAPPPPPPPVPNMSTVAEAAHILTARDEADAVEEADRRDAMNAHRQARDRSRGAAEALYAGEARVAAASAGLPDGWVAQLSRSEREVYY